MHPGFEIGNERPRLFPAHGKPLLRRLAVDGTLDLEQDVDAPHGLAGIGASPDFARSKNFLRPWLQQAASRIGAGFRLPLYRSLYPLLKASACIRPT